MVAAGVGFVEVKATPEADDGKKVVDTSTAVTTAIASGEEKIDIRMSLLQFCFAICSYRSAVKN